MANVIPAPTLGTQGWVVDAAGKLDTLLTQFMVAQKSQSMLYPVASLTEMVQRCGGDARKFISIIQQELQAYLADSYQYAQVEAFATTDLDLDPASRIDIQVNISINDAGTFNTYSRLLGTADSRLVKFEKLNNG